MKGKIVQKALDAMYERDVDVIELNTIGDAVDIVGTTGGDDVHYRIYFKDGEIDRIGCK